MACHHPAEALLVEEEVLVVGQGKAVEEEPIEVLGVQYKEQEEVVEIVDQEEIIRDLIGYETVYQENQE